MCGGAHAMRIIGYGIEGGIGYWLIANSWGKNWGLEGRVKYLRGTNLGGIEGHGVVGMPRKP